MATETTTLGFEVVGVESLDALAESVGDVKSALGALSKTKFRMDTSTAKKDVQKVKKALDDVVQGYRDASRQSEAMGYGVIPGKKQLSAIEDLYKKVAQKQKQIGELQKKLRQTSEGDALRDVLKAKIWEHQLEVRNLAKEGAARTKAIEAQSTQHKEAIQEVEDFRNKKWSEHISTVKAGAEKAFKSIADADPFGLSESVGGFFSALEKGSKAMAAKGAQRGGAGGMFQEKSFKALGKAAKLLSTAARSIGAMQGIWNIVKSSLDQTAELNAMILDTTGSLSLMGTTWGQFSTGAADARKLLGQIREEVTDLSTAWRTGTTPQEQLALLQSFERQNITIRSMKQQIEEGNSEFKKFTDFTWKALQLQKALGLEAEETIQAFSFFTRDLGMSVKEVDMAFHQIAQNAIEANMNTRDFFATVMQVSSNMALYGERVAEVAVLLNKLGKALGPQQAKQALQGIVESWRQMGDEQRVQMTLLSGTGKRLKELRREARSQFENIRGDLEKNLPQFYDASGKQLTPEIKGWKDVTKITDEQIAALNNGTDAQQKLGRRLENLREMTRNLKKGGATGAAAAMTQAGPGAAMQGFFDISKKMFGQPLNKLTGLNAMAFRKLTGIGMDQFRQLQGVQTQIGGERDALVRSIQSQMQVTGTVSDENQKKIDQMATHLGVKSDDLLNKIVKGDTAFLNEAAYLSSLTEEQRKEVTKQDGLMKSVAEQHLGATRKISKILETIVVKVLNKIANFVSGIWTSIVSWFDDFDKQAELKGLDDLARTVDTKIEKLRNSVVNEEDDKKKASIEKELMAAEKQRASITRAKEMVTGNAITDQEGLAAALREAGLGPQGKGNVMAGAGLLGDKGSRDYRTKMASMTMADLMTPGITDRKITRDVGLQERLGGANSMTGMAKAFFDPSKTQEEIFNPEYVQKKKALGTFIGGEGKKSGEAKYLIGLIEDFQTDLFKKVKASKGEKEASKQVKEFTAGMVDALRGQTPEQRQATLAALESAGVFNDMLAAAGDQEKLLKSLDKGMTIDRKSKDALAQAISQKFVEAQQKAELELLAREKGVWTGTGIAGSKLSSLGVEDRDRIKALADATGTKIQDVPQVQDAFFPMGGLAKLAPGDYVINRSAFESAGRGAMLAEAISREAPAAASGPGGSVSIVVNINGGDTEKIRRVVIDQIRYVERRRMKGQAV